MGKSWPALDIHVPGCDPELKELVYAELDDFQPTAVQDQEDPAPLRVFFSTSDLRDSARQRLLAAFVNRLPIDPVDVPDEDWAARSQAQLKAISIDGLTIAPPWDVEPENRPIVILPSMGFGTGHHATTRLVLKLIQKVAVAERRVLDVGCGSGVLALAAERLGAREALGIDVDYDAISSARDNLSLNEVVRPVRFEERDLETVRGLWDVVLANLTGALLERSLDRLHSLVTPGGHVVISGFTAAETGVIPLFESRFSLQSVEQELEWLAAVFTRA